MTKFEIGRLAFREEQPWWVAYWCPKQDSMEGNVELGRVRFKLIFEDPRAKAAFMQAMQAGFNHAVKAEFGKKPIWGKERTAPESERSGNA